MQDHTFSRRASDQSGNDTRALEIAMEAKTIILQHQKTCDEDRMERRKQIADLHTSVVAAKEEVRRVINRGMAWIISILIGCIGYFLVTYGLPGHHIP